MPTKIILVILVLQDSYIVPNSSHVSHLLAQLGAIKQGLNA